MLKTAEAVKANSTITIKEAIHLCSAVAHIEHELRRRGA